MHNLPVSLSAEACTVIFTYIIVVFVLAKLSIDDLGPEARRSGRFPPSCWLYLACMLSWPVTVGGFAGLLILGALHTSLIKAYELAARGTRLCRRRITRCLPKPRELDDLEMGLIVPLPLERVSWDDAEVCNSCSQAEMTYRVFVAALKEECGLTPRRWGRAP